MERYRITVESRYIKGTVINILNILVSIYSIQGHKKPKFGLDKRACPAIIPFKISCLPTVSKVGRQLEPSSLMFTPCIQHFMSKY